jgi:DNA-binding ferritin-like protein
MHTTEFTFHQSQRGVVSQEVRQQEPNVYQALQMIMNHLASSGHLTLNLKALHWNNRLCSLKCLLVLQLNNQVYNIILQQDHWQVANSTASVL